MVYSRFHVDNVDQDQTARSIQSDLKPTLSDIFVIDWLNNVLRRFQKYFSHITATAHIIHVFAGFHQY